MKVHIKKANIRFTAIELIRLDESIVAIDKHGHEYRIASNVFDDMDIIFNETEMDRATVQE
jgi:hypothetical protein